MHHDENVPRERKSGDEGFERLMLRDADIVKPIIEERFLKGYIFGADDSIELFRLYCDAFKVSEDMPVRMLLCKSTDSSSCEWFINQVECHVRDNEVLLGTMAVGRAIVVMRDMPDAALRVILGEIVELSRAKGIAYILSVYSNTIPIADIPETYERLLHCLEYSFYSDEPEVMCEDEIKTGIASETLTPRYIDVEKAVSAGDADKTKALLEEIYYELEQCIPPPAVAKTYFLELYICIIRCCTVEKIDKYMKDILAIQNGRSFGAIKKYITEKALEIADFNVPGDKNNMYSSLVKETLRIIEENLNNEKLSLRWIAKNNLFTNVDYLGKVFKKEVGKNFSYFVMERRMENAKKLIIGGTRDRVYEVAQKVGYGSNPQYFSQVFKKYTGQSPVEYKETARGNN